MDAVRKKVVAYLRVSSPEQSTDNQIPMIMDWVESRACVLIEVYEEHESAWKSGHQRELSRLFADLPKRKVDICLVWALDRLTREGIASIFNLINKFKLHGVQVVSLQEPWTEAGGPMADLLYAITAWVAEFESRRKSERTKAGLARAVMEGKKLGRPKGSKDKRKRKSSGYLLRYASPELRERYGK